MRNPIGLIIKRLLLLIFFLPAAYFATAQVVGTPYGITTLDCSSPAQPGAITFSATTVNLNATFTASVTAVSGATSYAWVLPSGLTGSSTTNSITIKGTTAGAIAATGITVTAKNDCGNSMARAGAGTITVRNCSAAPAQPGAISFSATTINLNATFTASVTAVSGATSYAWVLPSGLTGSSTTNSITIKGTTAGAKAASGITVTAKNDCGNSPVRTGTGTITVNAPGTVVGVSAGCAYNAKETCACPAGQTLVYFSSATPTQRTAAINLFTGKTGPAWWENSVNNNQNAAWFDGSTWYSKYTSGAFAVCVTN